MAGPGESGTAGDGALPYRTHTPTLLPLGAIQSATKTQTGVFLKSHHDNCTQCVCTELDYYFPISDVVSGGNMPERNGVAKLVTAL